jgi:ribA/ribD-fused uncharacterized protein
MKSTGAEPPLSFDWQRAGFASEAAARDAEAEVAKIIPNAHYRDLVLRDGPKAVQAALSQTAKAMKAAAETHTGGGIVETRAIPAEDSISFYSTKEKYGPFSNFSKHKCSLLKMTFPTSEHVFQWLKFQATDPEQAALIIAAKDAKKAADLGRDRSRKVRPDWEEVKDDAMRLAVLLKFGQNDDCRTLLLGTGLSHLIEDAPYDSYWGTGSGKGGGGKNMLGKILEEARRILRADEPVRARLAALRAQESGSHMEDDARAWDEAALLDQSPYERKLRELAERLGLIPKTGASKERSGPPTIDDFRQTVAKTWEQFSQDAARSFNRPGGNPEWRLTPDQEAMFPKMSPGQLMQLVALRFTSSEASDDASRELFSQAIRECVASEGFLVHALLSDPQVPEAFTGILGVDVQSDRWR